MKNIINKCLSQFGVELHGAGYMKKLRNSDIHKSEWDAQRQLLNGKADIIFDVGANRGETALRYKDIFPAAAIHAFEPFPESCEKFLENHKFNSNVVLNKIALSSNIGKTKFNVNSSVDTNSLLRSKNIGANSDRSCRTLGQIEIQTDTLDQY
jgi:FkbM family methyltransferase